MKKLGYFRIIAGRFRSRQLRIPTQDAVRPTLDRIREMIFNWLMENVPNSVCLDAFAGSGALGIEALSRGAKHVYFIEQDRKTLEAISENLQSLKVDNATLIGGAMPHTLSKIPKGTQFDLVFLDPPFRQDLILPSLSALRERQLLKTSTLIYAEVEGELDLEKILSSEWEIVKQSHSKRIGSYLFRLN